MSEWDEYLLGDLLQFQRGFDITAKEQEAGNVPVVSSSGITSFHNKAKVKGPGVITGRKGSLGKVHFIKSDYWPHDTTLWIKDFKGNNPKFLYYLLQQIHLENYDVGASNPTLNRNHLHKIRLYCPSPKTQQKISAVISAYDDLIENNKRRIALLEKAAEEIYREWFVRLRFPDWEGARFVKGVPDGWDVIKVADAFKFTGGGTPATQEKRYWENGTINWFTPTDITHANGFFLSESSEKCTEEGQHNSSARLFPAYCIMMTSRATIGAIGINTTPACTNQGFITCYPNDDFPLTFLYYWLKLNKSHFEMLSTGSTFAELTKGTFKKIKILKPEKHLVNQFEAKVRPMFQNMELLLREVELLKKSRDLLLPRLISGKLPVESLDIHYPPGMAAEQEPTHA